jgi:aspartyl-tRNA(Asn)/glutamyl-tRNA(Gln) amidotransferase subunit B
LEVTDEWIGKIKVEMQELPQAKRERYTSEYKLPEYDAVAMTSSKEMAEYFEETTRLTVEITRILIAPAGGQPVLGGVAKLAANWIKGDLAGKLNADNLDFSTCSIPPGKLARLLARILSGEISGKLAKEVFAAMWLGEDGGDPDTIIKNRGLIQISDSGELEQIVDQVIAANAQQVADYKAGKEKAFNSLVGQAMKLSKGKANPQQVSDILKRKLAG